MRAQNEDEALDQLADGPRTPAILVTLAGVVIGAWGNPWAVVAFPLVWCLYLWLTERDTDFVRTRPRPPVGSTAHRWGFRRSFYVVEFITAAVLCWGVATIFALWHQLVR